MNDKYYPSLQAAIDAVPADNDNFSSIRVCADIADFGALNIKDKKIHLNFNGHKLTGTSIDVDGANASLVVEDGG